MLLHRRVFIIHHHSSIIQRLSSTSLESNLSVPSPYGFWDRALHILTPSHLCPFFWTTHDEVRRNKFREKNQGEKTCKGKTWRVCFEILSSSIPIMVRRLQRLANYFLISFQKSFSRREFLNLKILFLGKKYKTKTKKENLNERRGSEVLCHMVFELLVRNN